MRHIPVIEPDGAFGADIERGAHEAFARMVHRGISVLKSCVSIGDVDEANIMYIAEYAPRIEDVNQHLNNAAANFGYKKLVGFKKVDLDLMDGINPHIDTWDDWWKIERGLWRAVYLVRGRHIVRNHGSSLLGVTFSLTRTDPKVEVGPGDAWLIRERGLRWL